MFACPPSLRRFRETERTRRSEEPVKGWGVRMGVRAKLTEKTGDEGAKWRRRGEGWGKEPLGGSDGRVFQLLVRTRSRDGFHGIIKMFVDVDPVRVATELPREGGVRRGTK